MPDHRLPIDDETIIELYKNGYSQNDITKQYAVSVVHARSVLKAAGFNTRGYRTLSPAAMKVIEALVGAGIIYVDIEAVCDISFHAIRDFVRRKNVHVKRGTLSLGTYSCSRTEEFLNEYRKGSSFCFLVKEMFLCEMDIIYLYHCIGEEDLKEHRLSLKALIEKHSAAGISEAGIVRMLDISRSLVRNGVPS